MYYKSLIEWKDLSTGGDDVKNNEYICAVKRNSNRLYLIAISFTKSHYSAEDIVQDVFLKLWKSNIDFEDKEHIDKWLTTVCINKSKDYIKSPFFRKSTILDDAKNLYTFDSFDSLDVFNAVMSLPKKERTIIHLFYYEDMTVKEISNILKVKESTIRTRLARAREKLKTILGDDWINE